MHNQTISQAINDLHLLNHPFYQAWMMGSLSKDTLKMYAEQYFAHVDAFPRYISAVHSQCRDSDGRRHLLENLNDEEGLSFGTPHPELWLRFAEGLGTTREQVASAKRGPAIDAVINTFFKLAGSSYAEGLGALYAYESQIPEIARSKIEGLVRNYGISDERTLEFFKVHETADVHHRGVLESMLSRLSPYEHDKALGAAREAAQALWNFLSEVYQTEPLHAPA